MTTRWERHKGQRRPEYEWLKERGNYHTYWSVLGLPNSCMLCFTRQLDERLSWFKTFLRRNSEYGCATQKEGAAGSNVSAPGGARYLNGYQLKIKVHCVTAFSASSFTVSTKRSSGHFLSCNLHQQCFSSNSVSFGNIHFPLRCSCKMSAPRPAILGVGPEEP